MDQLVVSLENLLKLENGDPSNFYTYLSNCVVSEQDEKYFMEEFIPKVYYLYEKKVLRKDIVYLSLLASENDRVLQKFLDYDRSVFVLNVDDATSFFDYYIYEKKHWVFEVINNPSGFDKIIQLPEIYNKFRMVKYVWETNSKQLDIEYLHSLSTQINMERLDEFWKLYLEEVTRFIDVVRFCKQFLKREVTDTELFTFASKHSLLDTLSNYTDLSDSTHWEAIKQKLHSSSDSELYIFSSFVIIGTLVRLLIHHRKDSSNSVFENVKTWLLEIQNKHLTIELLETIFQLMFHKTKNEFTCKEKDIRFILVLLKSVIEALLLKKTYEKNSDQYKKIILLNNQVTDFFWRLDLIINTKMTPKIEQHLLNYMLAPPESLIHICLKCRNFERAHQVIEIFNLRDSDIAHEVTYAESFLKFRKFLRKNGKLKLGIDETIDEFFQSNPPPSGRIIEDAVDRLSQKFDYMIHFKLDSEEFLNVFDFAFTGTKTWEESELMLTLTEKKFNLDESISSDLLIFYKKVSALAFEVGPKDKVPLPEILTNPKYPLDFQKYKTKEAFYDQLEKLDEEFQNHIENSAPGTFNKNHPSHKTLLKVNELCHNYAQELGAKEPRQYLYRLFNYLKAFSRVLYIEQNSSDIISKGKNTSYFHILNFNRSELTGKLLFERQLDPTEFEKYFGKLKLDFLYHIVGNCFPTINLHVQEDVTIEELYHDNMLYVPSPSIIIYIQKRNWLLAFILSEMYKVEGVKIDISEARLKTFFNYLKMPKIQHLKALFEKNDIIAALQNCINAHQVKLYFREHIVEHDLVSIQSQTSHNSDILETGEEILEDTKTTNWKTLYDTVESIPENQLKKKTDLVITKDKILVNLVHDGFEPEYYKYASFISDRDLRIKTILNNFKKWPGPAACYVIKLEITRFDCLRDSKVEALEKWLHHIELNEELKRVFDLRTWYKSYSFCNNYTESALDKILVTDQIDLLLDFIKLYKPSDEILSNITSSHVLNILDVNIPLFKIKSLLDLLPFDHAIGICHDLLTRLRNLEHLQFTAEYLANNVSDDPFLKNARVSLKMLSVFPLPEQEQLFCLIGEPLSIIEVLLMNTKLDKLAAVLELLNIKNCHDHDEVINVEKVDRILRTYAEKSLDFRVITNPRVRTPESKLLQSLDSLSVASDKKPFVVPENVPKKEEWVENEEVIECMCCRQVVFSMFNRRHHCRRCGRIVCYGCSLKRMLVPTYGDILVRVCSDCYHQTSSEKSDGFSDIPSSRSFSQEYWLLNDDPEHNKITREEFSYEHAPSTSLCFSILKYHSKSTEYSRFLLEQCEVMLKLLQPSEEPTHEIDYLLVVKMLKSLATAAKIGSLENMQDSGASMADRILSQAELLALLAERGCLNLMPLVGAQNLYVDAAVLRRLRDKLLQREQWNLALEVSTKAGLDNTGVFAAWGKSCLKAGSLLVAREKFQRCLDKNSQYETLSTISRQSDLYKSLESLSLGRSRFSSRISTSSTLSTENKPSKDPPLLNEIIYILETKTRTIRPEVLEKMQRVTISGSMTSLNQLAPFSVHIDTAISVVNRIKNLKQLTSRNFSLSDVTKIDTHASRPPLDPIFFDECIYYLKRYGTHLSLLEFLLRHGEIHTALLFILENKLTPDLFIEVYMKCLKEGRITFLQQQISLIDSSLNLWKDYLKQLCRHLEKHQLLNCLYQLQLYIGDYVRASMTCIRFYEENVSSFTELLHNVGHLYKGEEHLKQLLEQDQWVEVASVSESSTTSKDSFEERMLSNPDLVMKIETKDVHRHIMTVKRQIEVVNFLSKCESSGVDTRHILKQLTTPKDSKTTIPTLFGSTSDKINLAVMLILCGATVEEGFHLAIKIIEDFKLRPIKVYCLAGKQFARSERYNGISQLVNCIKSTGVNDLAISDMLDEMLVQTVGTLIKENVTGTKVEDLIKLIKDKGTKISAYIEAKQLKTAYFLAVKYKRTADIRRIQREAELLNMPTIKALCQKVLQSSQSHSKDS